MRNLTLNQAAGYMGVEGNCSEVKVTGVSVDSRACNKGDLFFALQGEKTDGHRYLKDVCGRAAAAVVQRDFVEDIDGLILIRVEDPLRALQELAREYLLHWKPKVVAITGSVGKTTTKEFAATLLKKKYRTGFSKGNHNSQIGVPLAILNDCQGDEEVIVLEMAMSHKGNLARLVKIAPPDIAVLTNVELVHAENFENLEEIAFAKGEILESPATEYALVHADLMHYEQISKRGSLRKLTFSVDEESCDFFLEECEEMIVITGPNGRGVFPGPLPFPGRHVKQNFLASTAIARALGLSWEAIQQGIRHLALPKMHMQLVEKKGVLFINDAYNACTLSMKAALTTLPTPKYGGKKIAVLGEMRELGKYSEECHREVGEYALQHVEKMYCLGEGCSPIIQTWEKAGRKPEFFSDPAKLVHALIQALHPGDVVLLKGANGTKMWNVLEEIYPE